MSAALSKLSEPEDATQRHKIADAELRKSPSAQGFAETLQTIQTLLLKVVRQGDASLRIALDLDCRSSCQ
jgi:hypothetical protein